MDTIPAPETIPGRLELARHHPAFDVGMELLCILGLVPLWVGDAAMDLGVDLDTVERLVVQLRERGYPICRGSSTQAPIPTHVAGIHYWLAREHARTVWRAAGRYYALVYGGEK